MQDTNSQDAMDIDTPTDPYFTTLRLEAIQEDRKRDRTSLNEAEDYDRVLRLEMEAADGAVASYRAMIELLTKTELIEECVNMFLTLSEDYMDETYSVDSENLDVIQQDVEYSKWLIDN